MGSLTNTLVPMLRLTRVTNAAAAVGNLWFVVLWSHAMPEETGLDGPVALHLLGATAAALGLYTYGTALNDLLDQKRDRVVRADRPLARGQISLEAACAVMIAALIVGVLGSAVFGMTGVLVAACVGLAVLWFNVAGRYIPAVGLVVLGLIYAAHMFIANVDLRFLWPVWVVMTHALVVAGLVSVLGRKVPRVSRRAFVTALFGWGFWSFLLGWRQVRTSGAGLWPGWVDVEAAYWCLAAAGGFVVLVIRKGSQVGWGPRAAEKTARYGSLWLPMYGAAWLIGVGLWRSALWLFALMVAAQACVIALRELRSLAEHPAGFRR